MNLAEFFPPFSFAKKREAKRCPMQAHLHALIRDVEGAVPYKRTSARPLFTLAPARKYQYVEKIAKIILNISICRKSIMKSNGKGERI